MISRWAFMGMVAALGIVTQGHGQAVFFFNSATPYFSIADTPAGFRTCQACLSGFEDFEDGDLDYGLTIQDPAGTGRVVYPGYAPIPKPGKNLTDSVDLDDGILDGTGQSDPNKGWAYYLRGAEMTITFPQPVTSAGFVFTDGDTRATGFRFEASGPNGFPLGTISGTSLSGQDNNSGETAEDRFLGVRNSAGISSLRLITFGGQGIEIDHVHFENANVTPLSPCDFNEDRAVDSADFGRLFAGWGTSAPEDVTRDGLVDAADAGVCFTEFTGDPVPVSSVPEPSPLSAIAVFSACFGIFRCKFFCTMIDRKGNVDSL